MPPKGEPGAEWRGMYERTWGLATAHSQVHWVAPGIGMGTGSLKVGLHRGLAPFHPGACLPPAAVHGAQAVHAKGHL